jgi:hypothetical protein
LNQYPCSVQTYFYKTKKGADLLERRGERLVGI